MNKLNRLLMNYIDYELVKTIMNKLNRLLINYIDYE